ncbi:MAG: hypothetical protein MJ228_04740 [Bacilli bacterium]|nr:hypothetical protein [Bacilli bacterium]
MKNKGFKLFALTAAVLGVLMFSSCSNAENNRDKEIVDSLEFGIKKEHEKGELIVGLDTGTSKDIASKKTSEAEYFKGTKLRIEAYSCLTGTQVYDDLMYLITLEDKSDAYLIESAKTLSNYKGVTLVSFNYIAYPA